MSLATHSHNHNRVYLYACADCANKVVGLIISYNFSIKSFLSSCRSFSRQELVLSKACLELFCLMLQTEGPEEMCPDVIAKSTMASRLHCYQPCRYYSLLSMFLAGECVPSMGAPAMRIVKTSAQTRAPKQRPQASPLSTSTQDGSSSAALRTLYSIEASRINGLQHIRLSARRASTLR